jgi:GNAT superfamily N-acetyltransferase
MKADDIDFCMRMKDHVGWNQIPADWERFMALDPDGCFIAELDGEPVGTGTVVTYGTALAWIGMIIVDETKRRMGIGRAIMLACMEYCKEKGIEVIKLDATPLGNKLYLTLGFVEEYLMDRREGRGATFSYTGVVPMTAEDLADVIRYDAEKFGVERPGVIEGYFNDYPKSAFVARDGDTLTGFLMIRNGKNAQQIGPWVADDAAVAEELFKAGLSAVGDNPVFFDIVAVNSNVLPLVCKYGFVHQRPFVRMYYKQNKYPGDPACVYAVSGVEKG